MLRKLPDLKNFVLFQVMFGNSIFENVQFYNIFIIVNYATVGFVVTFHNVKCVMCFNPVLPLLSCHGSPTRSYSPSFFKHECFCLHKYVHHTQAGGGTP